MVSSTSASLESEQVGRLETPRDQAALRAHGRPLQVAVMLWSGHYGGAETWSIALARAMHRAGTDAGIVVIGDPGPLSASGLLGGLPVV